MKRLLALTAVIVMVGGIALSLGASGTTRHTQSNRRVVRALTCLNKTVVRPRSFIISCADANSELTRTHWRSWSATKAVGTTRFGLNLCNPYCAASRVQFFPESRAIFSAPMHTKHHGWLFSSLVVTYKLHGKTKRFSLSWKGTPAFS